MDYGWYQPPTTKRTIRITRPSAGRVVKAFLIVMAIMYFASVLYTWAWIEDSGMGLKPGESIVGILFAIAVVNIFWTPLTMTVTGWGLVPLALILAVLGASIRWVPVPTRPARRRAGGAGAAQGH